MKKSSTLGEVRRMIREEVECAVTLNELFGTELSFSKVLDSIMQDLTGTGKKIEKAHELAPAGQAKAIVAGLHSDLFNKAAEFRKYIEQLKNMTKR